MSLKYTNVSLFTSILNFKSTNEIKGHITKTDSDVHKYKGKMAILLPSHRLALLKKKDSVIGARFINSLPSGLKYKFNSVDFKTVLLNAATLYLNF